MLSKRGLLRFTMALIFPHEVDSFFTLIWIPFVDLSTIIGIISGLAHS